ncbi:YceD family protein [Sphingomonas sp. PB4P5]|uniref:YceD family protein n=1 Tax=Parasphingomonas puruogangriensis TaxID=3096155 RepID=UPI002FCA0961
MTPPEFSRLQRRDTIGSTEHTVSISATEAERAALAKRFGLIGLNSLEATLRIRTEAAGIVARGTVSAAVVQACSVTDEPLKVAVNEDIAVRFIEEDAVNEEEIELSEDALDTMFYSGGGIDLGEAAAETVALAIDPFLRGPNAARVLKAAGVISEDEAKPAGALAGLRDLLGKG